MMIKIQFGLFLACIFAVYAVEGQDIKREPPLVLDEDNSKSSTPQACIKTIPVARGRGVCTSLTDAYGSRDAQAAIAEAKRRATGEAKYTQPTDNGGCLSRFTGIRWIHFCRAGHCTWAYVYVPTWDCVRPNEGCCKGLKKNCRCITRRVTRYVWAVMSHWWGHHGGTCPYGDWCIRHVRITYNAGCRCSCYCGYHLPYRPGHRD